MTDALDALLGGGGKTAFTKDSPIGATVTGTVTAVEVRQMTNFESGKPESWDDGKPKQQIVVTVTTDERDAEDPDDDGARNVYIKAWGDQMRALRKTGKPEVGDTFTAKFSGVGEPPKKGLNPPKFYEFTVVKGAGAVDAMVGNTPAAKADEPVDTAKIADLRAVGLDDDKIAAALGVDAVVVAAVPA